MSEMSDAREIIPHPRPPRPETYAANIVPGGEGGPRFWHNLPRETRPQRALITRCLANATLESSEILNRRFEMIGCLIHNVRLLDKQSGELLERVRCVLCDQAGRTVAFVSDGVFKGLSLILLLEGEGPWPAPVPVIVRQVRTQSGGHTYTMELAEDDPAVTEAREARRGK